MTSSFYGGDNTYDLRLFQEFKDVIVSDTKCQFYMNSPNPGTSTCPYRICWFLRTFFPTLTLEEISEDYIKYAKQLIRPSQIILQDIPEGIENAYGIHLRKTDKVKDYGDTRGDIRHEHTDYEFDILIRHLLEDVTQIIITESSPSFLLVSEDKSWKNKIQLTIESIATKNNKTIQFLSPKYSVEHEQEYQNYRSVLDMFCLSKCKDILQGVKFSTFSILAALLGNNKLRNYSKYIDTGNICLIHSWNSVLEINGQLNFDIVMHYENTIGYSELEINPHPS